MTLKHHFNKNH